jgi:lysophospholipase L1-like esterase
MTARGRFLSGLVATVIALAGFVTVGAPTAAAGISGTLQYVALGDSYAAGIGAPPYVRSSFSDDCLQSNKGYPELLDSEKHIHLQVNATCPGATTSAVADTQLSALTPGVELVTLTVGGNDLGFAALAGACLPPTGTPEQCRTAIQAALDLLPTSCEGDSKLGDRLTDLYAAVAAAAPKALIVVTGYPYLFELLPTDPDLAIKTQINAATTLLNCAIAKAVTDAQADGVNIIYVDVTDQFKGHGIGSDNPFINDPTTGVPGAVPFHPNAAGYRAYADAISAAIQEARQKQLA